MTAPLHLEGEVVAVTAAHPTGFLADFGTVRAWWADHPGEFALDLSRYRQAKDRGVRPC